MKKSVILTLIAVYVISIFVVGYFGLNVRIYEPNVPPQSIEITSVTYNDTTKECILNENGYKYVPQIMCYDDELVLQIRYLISPDNATDKSVTYSFDPAGYVSQSNGYLVFTRPENNVAPVGVWVTITPKDNNTISDKIYISVRFI